jgi:hypothetical protein
VKRKLLLLNAVLAGLVVFGATELYRQYVEAENRYAILQESSTLLEAPQAEDPKSAPAVRPADYAPVVQRMLFAADRNPIVEVAAPEAVVVKRPQLPRLAGLVNFGPSPMALMAVDSNSQPEWVEVGQKAGAYVFEGIEGDRVKLSWNGEPIVVSQTELAAQREAPPPRQAKAARKRPADAPPATPAAAAPVNLTESSAAPGGEYKIGDEFVPGRFRADPNDGAADGTEYNGYTKRVRRTPFGAQAWWEKRDKK